jgi:serine/threonine protein kinase
MPEETPEGEPTRLAVQLTKGTSVGHYVIVEKIGAGGMGEVYLAEDTQLNRQVALKFLSFHLCQDADCRTRFKREAQAAAKLNHPNIVTIHEVSEFNGRPFFAMEHVQGQSLRELIKAKELPIERVIELAIQICEGLHKAHQSGIVHRDVKPANILIDADGRAKILDFGLASVAGTNHLTKTGSTLGTIGYMSPEQVRGEQVDHRTDIFSLGVVLYEMITGKSPFKGDNDTATSRNIIDHDPEPLARYKTGVDAELQRIISKALQKDRALRYQHTDELSADLKSVRSTGETSAATRAPSRSTLSKRKWAYLVAGLAILAIAFVLLKTYVLRPADEPLDSLAVLPLQNLSGDPNQEYFSDGMTEALITELQKIRSLRVISRTSVMRFKKTNESLPEIAKQLTVKAVVEGSVLRDGNNVRITVQLIQASPEKHLWASNFDRPMQNILALQSEVAQAIANEIGASLTPQERTRLASAGSVIPEAYDAYLLGRNYRTELDFRKALEHFHRAIQIDPKFALGYAGLADCYTATALYMELSPDEAAPNALDAAAKAVQLDDKLAEAHAALSYAKLLFAWDLPGAERELLRALELNPNSPDVIDQHRLFLVLTDRAAEAVPVAIRSAQVQPGGTAFLGWTYFYARRYDDAIAQLKKELKVDPNPANSRIWLATAYAFKGMHKEALAECDHLQGMHGGFDMNLGYIYAVAGRRDKSLLILDRLRELGTREYVDPYSFASIYAGLGDKDQTIAWLRKGLEARSINMVFLKIEPFFDSLRSDPRFRELLKNVGLEQ